MPGTLEESAKINDELSIKKTGTICRVECSQTFNSYSTYTFEVIIKTVTLFSMKLNNDNRKGKITFRDGIIVSKSAFNGIFDISAIVFHCYY